MERSENIIEQTVMISQDDTDRKNEIKMAEIDVM